MLLRSFVSQLDRLVPPALAEDWDNVGFQIGDPDREIVKALVVVDVNQDTLREALERKVEIILAHHPLIFDPLKKIIRKGQGHLAFELIREKIALYVAHTNLDVALGGLADLLGEVLEIKDLRPLVHSKANPPLHFLLTASTDKEKQLEKKLKKLLTREVIEDYALYREEKLLRFEGRVHKLSLGAMKSHLGNFASNLTLFPTRGKSKEGLGRIGHFDKPISGKALVDRIKKRLSLKNLRYCGPLKKKVGKVALLPGSGGGYLHQAYGQGADAFITADIKHHTGLEADELGILVIDPGHYGTEQFTISGWSAMIREVCPDVEILESRLSTDPFYFA